MGIYLFASFALACGIYIIATARRKSERERGRGGYFDFAYSVSNLRFVGFGFCFMGLIAVVGSLVGFPDS